MAKALTITSTRVEDGAIVLVDAVGPRGGPREFTVFLDRRTRAAKLAVQTKPEVGGVLNADMIPPEVATAAMRADYMTRG